MSLLDGDVALAALRLIDMHPDDATPLLAFGMRIVICACAREGWRARLQRGGALSLLARARGRVHDAETRGALDALMNAVNGGQPLRGSAHGAR